ncbi:MAG: hypothetical protein GX610_17695 [Rhodococcus sp.]|nr:hypothetical protein [Rhodococcus sp. (in: high G+C Gram-positive bacteria)]
MNVVLIVCAIVLAIASLAVSVPKLRLEGTAWTMLRSRALVQNQVRMIGAAEIAGAAGVLVGLFVWPIGAVAAGGLLLLGLAATGFHAKHGDYGNPDTRATSLPSVYFAVLAAVTFVLFLVAH